MFLSERREFPSASCLAGGKKLDDNLRLEVAEIANLLPSLFPGFSIILTIKNKCFFVQYWRFTVSI